MNPEPPSIPEWTTELPEVPYHELPPADAFKAHKGLAVPLPNGAFVEIWEIVNDTGYYFRFRRQLGDGRQSLLKFCLSQEAAIALLYMLSTKLETSQIPPDLES